MESIEKLDTILTNIHLEKVRVDEESGDVAVLKVGGSAHDCR